MAVIPQIVISATGTAGRTAGNHIKFICTTEAELPSVGVIENDEADCLDTGRRFVHDGQNWVIRFPKALISSHRAGVVALINGAATVNSSTVTAKTVVLVGFKTLFGTSAGILTWEVVAGVSFTITSVGATGSVVATDSSVVWYVLLESP